jgi:flagellar hook-basal body complex protein FliE
MALKTNAKQLNDNKSKFLKNAIKAINNKQEETIQKANKIIGDVENFEKEVSKKFLSYL